MELFDCNGNSYKGIEISLLNDKAQLPHHSSTAAAGYDLYAAEDATLYANETRVIGTGLAMAIPEGYFGAIFARSGLATKQGLRPANCVGVVDSDYRGEIKVALHNDSEQIRSIKIGDRIAQIVFIPYARVCFVEVNELDSTARGAGGFGSTGTN